MTNRVSIIIQNDTINRGITIESNGEPDAKASTSSATGLGQYLNQSWLGALYEWGPLNIARRIKKTGNPKKPFSVPDGGERAILDMRKAKGKPELLKLNIDIFARDWEHHAQVLGKGWVEGDLYMCHFLGEGAAKKVFRADPNTLAVAVCGQAAADANPTIFYAYEKKVRIRPKTCAELRAWAAHAMKTRWDSRGRPDWIAKYYPQQPHPDPEPAPIEAHEEAEKPPVKMDLHERDDDEAQPAEAPSGEREPVPVPLPRARPKAAPKTAPTGETIVGDPDMWWLQHRLKAMHYYSGVLDGGYGGKLAGAITGFLNDRGETSINPPNSNEAMAEVLDEVKDALDRAEADGFVRPVTMARKNADPTVVHEIAPETIPVKRNFITGLIASGGSAVLAIFNGLKDDIAGAWQFFTDHQDDIPEPIKDNATSLLGSVPGWVWLIGATLIFALFAFNSNSGLKQIIDKIKTGER
jgi:hypothetical protein